MSDPFAAGWADGATDRPMDAAEIAREARRHWRYLLPRAG